MNEAWGRGGRNAGIQGQLGGGSLLSCLPRGGVLLIGTTQAGWEIDSKSGATTVYLVAGNYWRDMRSPPWERRAALGVVEQKPGATRRGGKGRVAAGRR